MKKYKSWKSLKKRLEGLLCEGLRGRVTYFLTRYHRVHNAYGRAAVLLDGRELVRFSWTEMYRQEIDLSRLYTRTGEYDESCFKEKWDNDCTYSETDFLSAALDFINMPIAEALKSENSVIRVLAVMDGRVGRRTLQNLDEGAFPEWARAFYRLRLEVENIGGQ
ncbi:MAG: hypothetical protein NC299_13065 [Lachnospiraceae bacterium]|nr:hypothetical protein [Ruminococcus sp.]MCM1275601.1 hypothetical protein [Lachnospiraceae bacterium]MCM1276268.1 hypothetical protein [Lachnospiraceae bacterium]